MEYAKFLKKKKLKIGDLVQVHTQQQDYKGYVFPQPEASDSGCICLKLENGYNTGISIAKIRKIKKLGGPKKDAEPAKEAAAKAAVLKQDNSLPRIAILHTGGTIASKVNYSTGGVIASFSAEGLIGMFPELAKIACIESVFVSNIMSEDMRVSDFQKISKAVAEQAKKGVKGVIIGHGTDMLGYSAAALAFELENCPMPALFVGAQRSSDRPSSDAAMNLICAAMFIAKTNFKGVAVCMHNSSSDYCCAIMPATKVRKLHTSRRDAFKTINDTPIALVDYRTGKIEWTTDPEKLGQPKGKFRLLNGFSEKVGLLKMHPFVTEKEIDFYRKNKYKGLIIEATGLGHTPVRKNNSFVKAIKKLVDSGCIVGIASQCLYGRVNPLVYTNLRKVAATGAIYCEDMLPETAVMKLAWLLGNYTPKEARELLAKNMRGEISDFTKYEG